MGIWALWKNWRRTKKQCSSGRKAERRRQHARYPTFEHSRSDTERRFNKGAAVPWVLRWTRRAVSNRYGKEIARKAQRWREQTCKDDRRYAEGPSPVWISASEKTTGCDVQQAVLPGAVSLTKLQFILFSFPLWYTASPMAIRQTLPAHHND